MIRPFVSSTRDDLQDCIPDVIRTIEACGAEPITMETWDTSFEDVVHVCKCKVQESTHYIGIFAYRYGWIPYEKVGQSITEIEFNTAFEVKNRSDMVIFLPVAISPYGRELKRRAKQKETPEKLLLQEAFINRVKSQGAILQFADQRDLLQKVKRRIEFWVNDPQHAIGTSPVSRQAPARVHVHLGRKAVERSFEDIIEISTSHPACFLLYGPASYGQKQVILRMRHILARKLGRNIRHFSVSAGVSWLGDAVGDLPKAVIQEINPAAQETSFEYLKNQLQKLLEVSDVMLELHDIHRLNDCHNLFGSEFWQQFAYGLGQTRHKFVTILSFSGKLPMLPERLFCDPRAEVTNEQNFDSAKIVKLPELKKVTHTEIWNCLRKIGLSNDEADKWSDIILDETDGGHPELVHNRLEDVFKVRGD